MTGKMLRYALLIAIFVLCMQLYFVGDTAAQDHESKGNVLSYLGNEFVIGFVENVRSSKYYPNYLKLIVTTHETQSIRFTVSTFTGFSITSTAIQHETTVIDLPYDDLIVKTQDDRNKGIHVKAEGNKTMAIYALNGLYTYSAESYLALPCQPLPIDEYKYYALTYNSKRCTLNDDYCSPFSTILLVGCENSTKVSTVLGSFILNKQETYLIESTSDLSGTLVSSDKPLVFLAGHKGLNLMAGSIYPNILCEQIPPTAAWGLFFLVTDFPDYSSRFSIGKVRILAELESTTVHLGCNVSPTPGDLLTFEAPGEYHEITFAEQGSSCTISSNKPVLVMQYPSTDYEKFCMTMLLPTEHYSNDYIFFNFYTINWVTIYVTPIHFQKNKIYIDFNVVQAPWTAIHCSNGSICGYHASVSLAIGKHLVYHTEEDARIGVIVRSNRMIAYPAGLVASVQTYTSSTTVTTDSHQPETTTVPVLHTTSTPSTTEFLLSLKSVPKFQLSVSPVHHDQISTRHTEMATSTKEPPSGTTKLQSSITVTAVHTTVEASIKIPDLAARNSALGSTKPMNAPTSLSVPSSSPTASSPPSHETSPIIFASVGVVVIIIAVFAGVVVYRFHKCKHKNSPPTRTTGYERILNVYNLAGLSDEPEPNANSHVEDNIDEAASLSGSGDNSEGDSSGNADHTSTSATNATKLPTLDKLIDRVKTTDWYKLGLKLHIDRWHLNIIRKDNQHDTEAALEAMLEKWISTSKSPTWRTVVDALRAISDEELARELEEQFC